MGRIKTKVVKRTSFQLVDKAPELFAETFEHNKRVLGNTMSSKKVRNMVAGYITRLKRNNKKIIAEE